MTSHQLERCKKAVEYRKNGAPASQKEDLPNCFVKNASSTYIHGQEITENITTWTSEGYEAGAFDGQPFCPNVRINPLIAVVQPGKLRLACSRCVFYLQRVVKRNETETVKMATARQFSQIILIMEVKPSCTSMTL